MSKKDHPTGFYAILESPDCWNPCSNCGVYLCSHKSDATLRDSFKLQIGTL